MERRKIHDEVLRCCGYKRCPRVEIFDDGSLEISDDDTASGSVGTIKIRPEAVALLEELLKKRNQ